MGIFMEQLFSLPKMSPRETCHLSEENRKKKNTIIFLPLSVSASEENPGFPLCLKTPVQAFRHVHQVMGSRGSLVVIFDHVPKEEEKSRWIETTLKVSAERYYLVTKDDPSLLRFTVSFRKLGEGDDRG